MDSDDGSHKYLSIGNDDNQVYSSLKISSTPKMEPQSTDYPSLNFLPIDPSMRDTLLPKPNIGKPSLKPFIISSIIICVIILCIVGAIHIRNKSHSSSLYNSSMNSFLDEDANGANGNGNLHNNAGGAGATGNSCTNSDIDCNGHGTCNYASSGCKCDLGYTTYNSLDGTECEFGAGRYYVGDYLLGSIKLCLIFIGCCVACCSIMGSYAAENSVLLMVGYCALFCSACGLGIWCIVDIILFAINDIPDQNGVDLAPW